MGPPTEEKIIFDIRGKVCDHNLMTATFTKDDFEKRMKARINKTSTLFDYYGIIAGEYVFTLKVSEFAEIMIRSSVRLNGVAASTGKDSIRCWLVNPDTKESVGSKVSKYITRVDGWEDRLVNSLRKLYKMGLILKNADQRIYITRDGRLVIKEGETWTNVADAKEFL